MMLTVFLSSLVRGSLPNDIGLISYAGSMTCAAIIGIAVLARGGKVRFKSLYNLAEFFLLIGLLLFTVENQSVRLIASVFAVGGYVAFDIFTTALLSNICARYRISPLWMFGLLNGATGLMFDVGYGFGVSSALLPPSVCAFAMFSLAIVTAMSFTLLMTDCDYRTSWGTVREGTSLSPVSDYYEALPERCSLVAQQYGLSRREEEVLILLAQRKTAGDIERELFISNSTVKSHVRSIYRKLDIHKKDELLAMLGHPSTLS